MTSINLAQRIILAAGGLILSAMFLFPPWVYVYRNQHTTRKESFLTEGPDPIVLDIVRQSAGYSPIFDSPAQAGMYSASLDRFDPEFVSVHIDVARLIVQAVGTAVLIVALLIAVSSKKQRAESSGRAMCAPCRSDDHRFHDSDACTNPISEDANAGQCQCPARIPVANASTTDQRERVNSTRASQRRALSPDTQRRLTSWKRLVVRGRHLRRLRESSNSPNGHHRDTY